MRDYGTTNNTPAHQAPPVWRAPEGLEDLTAAQVGDGGACQHTNDKPDRLEAAARPAGPGRGAGGRRQGLAGLRDRPLRAKLACGDLAGGPPPTGTHSSPAQQNKPRGGRAWPGIEPTRRAPSAANAQLVWRTSEGPAAVSAGGGRAWPGFEKTRRANHQHTLLHWCGGHRGPGRGAGGRRQGLAGLRDRPLRAKLACGDLAGGTPPTGTNTQAQTLSHKYIGTTKPPGPTGGRAAHASGR